MLRESFGSLADGRETPESVLIGHAGFAKDVYDSRRHDTSAEIDWLDRRETTVLGVIYLAAAPKKRP
jgi:hypothetical protein